MRRTVTGRSWRSRVAATTAVGLLPLMTATGCRAQDTSGSATVPSIEAEPGESLDGPADAAVSGLSEAELDRLESVLDETEDLVDDVEQLLNEPIPGDD